MAHVDSVEEIARKIGGANLRPGMGAEQDTFEHVPQFTGVAGPVIADEHLLRIRSDLHLTPPPRAAEIAGKPPGEWEDVAGTLPKRRHVDRQHPQPVKQFGSEASIEDTLFDRGFFTSHDAKTGKEIYGRQRVTADASAFTASPWAYNGKIFAMSEDGDTYVIQAGPEFKVLRKNQLNEMALATPAVARGSLFIRTASRLYRITTAPNAEPKAR